MKALYIGIAIAALLALAVGGWIVRGARKVLAPQPRLRPRAV